MPHEQFDPQIEELSRRWSRAEEMIATLLVAAAGAQTYAELEETIRGVAEILEALLRITLEWVEGVIPEAYRQGAQEAAISMVLSEPERISQEMMRRPEHAEFLRLLQRDVAEDLAAATGNINRDAKKKLREIGRRQLQKALARGNPVARVPDMKAELEEHQIAFVDAGGRRWKLGDYVSMALRTQSAIVLNAGHANAALELGSPGVQIFDGGPGDVDTPCEIANGQVWSVAYFLAHLIEHPNCRRSGAAKPRTWSGKLDRDVEEAAA